MVGGGENSRPLPQFGAYGEAKRLDAETTCTVRLLGHLEKPFKNLVRFPQTAQLQHPPF